MGYSFGGYYAAPRRCVRAPLRSLCVPGALHWDLHAWQSKIKEQLKADPLKSAQSNFQFPVDPRPGRLGRGARAREAVFPGGGRG